MKFQVIDYSEEYFLRVKKKGAVPAKRGGKFVIVEEVGEQYAVFAPMAMALFHANIVERFVESRGAVGQYNPKRDEYQVDTPGWEVKGGGRWRLDEEEGLVEVFGISMAYGGVDCNEFAKKLREMEAFGWLEIVAR